MLGIIEFIQDVDPRLWSLTIAVVVGWSYWLWKLIHPKSFEGMPSRLKALPGALIAAVLSGATASELGEFILNTVIGALTAGGGHEFIQRALKGSKAERAGKERT